MTNVINISFLRWCTHTHFVFVYRFFFCFFQRTANYYFCYRLPFACGASRRTPSPPPLPPLPPLPLEDTATRIARMMQSISGTKLKVPFLAKHIANKKWTEADLVANPLELSPLGEATASHFVEDL